jgi:hypothetical protein
MCNVPGKQQQQIFENNNNNRFEFCKYSVKMTEEQNNSVQYLIVQEYPDDNEAMDNVDETFVTDEKNLFEALAQKHSIERPGLTMAERSKNWTSFAEEYVSLTNINISDVDELKKKWKSIKSLKRKRDEEVKNLHDSIAKALSQTQNFQVNQVEDGDGTSTTIVLLDDKTNPQSEDLISLALTESGLEVQRDDTDHDLEDEELAYEILNEHDDPKLVRKRLKWEKKIRTEDSAFFKKRTQVERLIGEHKTTFDHRQKDIAQLEFEVRRKESQLSEIMKSLK